VCYASLKKATIPFHPSPPHILISIPYKLPHIFANSFCFFPKAKQLGEWMGKTPFFPRGLFPSSPHCLRLHPEFNFFTLGFSAFANEDKYIQGLRTKCQQFQWVDAASNWEECGGNGQMSIASGTGKGRFPCGNWESLSNFSLLAMALFFQNSFLFCP
jgi:hypothetical protein